MTPSSGYAGSTVFLAGTAFGPTPGENLVSFGSTQATVTAASATSLTVVVPSSLTPGRYDVSVSVAGQSTTAMLLNGFAVKPLLQSIHPATATAGASVELTGSNFDAFASGDTVTIGGVTATVTLASTTSLTVTVPSSLPAGVYSVEVKVAGQTSSLTQAFTLNPTLTSLNPVSGLSGATVTLTGTAFSPTKTDDVVKFGAIAATVSAATLTSLTVTVPPTALVGLGPVSVTVAGLTATLDNAFTVLPPVPAAPALLTATGSLAQITLTWAASTNATSYDVFRSNKSGGPYTQLTATAALTVTDTGLLDGATWYYVVQAKNTSGSSGNSNEAMGVTRAAAPLTVTASCGPGQATLSWAASAGASGYSVLRSTTAGGPYSPAGTTPSTGFTDTGLAGPTAWYFVVQATNAAGASANSVETSCTTTPAELLVGDGTLENVKSFARSANGDSLPNKTFGWLTQVAYPYALALDTVNSRVFVSGVNGGVEVFSRTATGNVPPSYSIALAPPQTLTGYALAVDVVNSELYVCGSTSMMVFDLNAMFIATPKRTLTVVGKAVLVDTLHDEIFVTKGAEVDVFNRLDTGTAAPKRVISGAATTLTQPFGLALDTTHDELFVTNFQTGAGLVSTFSRTATGNVAPVRSIAGTNTLLNDSIAVAFDPVHDELEVTTNGGYATAFARTATGNVSPARWVFGFSRPLALAVDPAANEIFITEQTGAIDVMDRLTVTNKTLKRIISGQSTGVLALTVLATDPKHQELYAAGSLGITVYDKGANGDVVPKRTFKSSTGGFLATGLAVDTVNDEVFVDTYGGILVFPRAASGTVTPLRSIFGPTTLINGAYGMAIDPAHNEIFVALGSAQGQILVFSRTGNGNVAPLRVISGALTGLPMSADIGYDPAHDELAVVGFGVYGNTVTVHARTSSGNVAPLRSFGESLGLGGATNLSIDASNGEYFVADAAGNSKSAIVVFNRLSSGTTAPTRILTGTSTGLLQPSAVVVW